MPRLVHVLSVPDSLVFLRGQVAFMRSRGWDITVVTSPGEALDAFGRQEQVATHGIPLKRAITPAADLVSLAKLTRVIRGLRPDIVHAHTPKGGLIGSLAAAAARAPARIYHMRGLPLMTATGRRRALLTATERTACAAATHVLCVSHSLRDVALGLKLCRPEKIEVLLHGSGNGVDARGRFNPDKLPADTRAATRRSLGLAEDAVVFGFIGRLVVDKGIRELAAAWREVREQLPTAHLLLAGVWEPQDPVPADLRTTLENDPRVHVLGFRNDTPALYSAMDAVVLPTYREGFPNVLLEAAAMGRAVIATRIPGCVDAVQDGTTGVLVPAMDSGGLRDAMLRLGGDPGLRAQMGAAGRARVLEGFDRERLWQALADCYERQRGRT
jgi:glycosyltransferase involved in cell wall biosynthesis